VDYFQPGQNFQIIYNGVPVPVILEEDAQQLTATGNQLVTGSGDTGTQEPVRIAENPIGSSSNTSECREPEASSSSTGTGTGTLPAGRENIEFLRYLIEDFEELVVNFLDQEARTFIKEQVEIADERQFKRVKTAIESRVLSLLLNFESISEPPNAGFFRQIVSILATKYPYMFLADPEINVEGVPMKKFVSRGTGGVIGISCLPKVLRQKFSRLLEEKNGLVGGKRKPDLPDGSCKQPSKKKKKVYGTPKQNYYPPGSAGKDTFLAELKYVESVQEREEMFKNNRDDVQYFISTSIDMFGAVPGFFADLTHSRSHYEWLFHRNIADNIDRELPAKLKILRAVVVNLCPTKEFRLKLELANLKSKEHNGSYVPEYICLLRQLNLVWHKTHEGLFRFPTEVITY
jgi:hypothetical protein